MACKCFDGSGHGTNPDILACMEYARTNGARIINASFGVTNSLAASNAFVSLRNAGIMVAAACGNGGTNTDVNPVYPAGWNFDNVVSVAALTRSNTLANVLQLRRDECPPRRAGRHDRSTFAATDNFYLTGTGTSFSALSSVAPALMLVKISDGDASTNHRPPAGRPPILCHRSRENASRVGRP